ncbi:twitching motility protein PilT [Acetitomaculum ruminis DSM 5522]|uniref:Twitching motility protein PilT n=1 Tax=Acetitomaculum ruminis DSM 5522 TaxID=1120918 RepID=A0A1I0ZKX5_9FIRM|nr:PilT/PilU family type 4a pilus ATPase [Acetitomaculum ruminis]SFB24863.1 twitching motility protein PilT [Acetitomaculum ruminis DSM 5522]
MDIEEIIKSAEENKASDIHLSVGTVPRFRIHGQLKVVSDHIITPQDTKNMVLKLLPPVSRKALERRGDVDFATTIPQVGRIRVNVFMQRGCYSLAIRLFPTKLPTPKALGIPDSVEEALHKKRGMFLITGPTGSGKSTTLAALINVINQTESLHVITIEDPIEFLYHHNKALINQREIGIDTPSFAMGIKAAMRENPDVIVISNLYDIESINMAIAAADAGHMVLSSLPTAGVINTIEHLVDIFPTYQQQQIRVQLSNALKAVISQELLREEDESLNQIAAFEILFNNAEVAEAIREDKLAALEDIMERNKKNGMQTMDNAIYDMYLKRYITKETLVKYSKKPIPI